MLSYLHNPFYTTISMDWFSGLEEGAWAIYPEVVVKRYIVHLIQNSLKYLPTKYYKDFTAHLKKIYNAPNIKAYRVEFERFCQVWSKYPGAKAYGEQLWQCQADCVIRKS